MNIQLYTAPTKRSRPMRPQWLKGGLVTRDVLEDMYINKGMSSNDIARHFDVTPQAVCNKIKKLGIPRRPSFDNLVGKKFGKLTVMRDAGRNQKGSVLWFCHCDCGKTAVTITSLLKSGATKSCGCLVAESARLRKGAKHPSYKGGKTNKEGYVQILDHGHPNANKRGRVLEHVFVMAKHLGRPIMRGETIHHKNGIRNDNRIENLELRTGQHGAGACVSDMIEFCVDYLKKYSPEKLARNG